MRRIGEVFDAAAAFTGTAVAGVALFLPITFTLSAESTPYRLANLIYSVPRGAAIGLIVAVAVAVLVITYRRPEVGWLVAVGGALGMFVNHVAGRNVSSVELLTTQNYADSVCAGVLLGGLGAAVLRRAAPATGYALGGVGFFVFGDLTEFLDIANEPQAVQAAPPSWLIGTGLALLIIGALRSRSRPEEPSSLRQTVDLPVTPILAAMVLALVILAGTEWLSGQYSDAPEEGHAVDIGLAVGATAIAAMVAAMLLPGRDGTGVFLSVSLVATADAIGVAPPPGWSVPVLIGLTAIGLFFGIRLPSKSLAILSIAGLAVFAMATSGREGRTLFAAGIAGLALTAGYCGGAARPHHAPSGVLAIAALYLPSIITALPLEHSESQLRDGTAHSATPGRIALAITLCCAIGLAVLHRFRPRTGPKPDAIAAC